MGASAAAEGFLQVYLLGSPELRRGSEVLPPLPTQKTMSLLAYLLLYKDCSHPREKLAALYGGDVSDQQARHSLRTALATLRRELGGDLFLADRESVQVNPGLPIWVDALEFEKQALSANTQRERWSATRQMSARTSICSSVALPARTGVRR